jgi:hypothetical protein
MPENPSQFYECPHCRHVMLKDSTMMMLAGSGAGFGILGGVCKDCHQPLDAEKVYVKCEYDLSVAQIVKGNYGKDVLDNILAAYKAGKVKLSAEELELLSPSPAIAETPAIIGTPLMKKPSRRKALWLLLLLIPVAAGVIFFASRKGGAADEFGVPPAIRTSVLDGAAEGSKIISAQMVQSEGLEMWCVVTSSGQGLERWIASNPESGTMLLISDAGWQNFSKIGCSNWSAGESTQAAAAMAPAATTTEEAVGPAAGGEANFNIPVFGVVIPYPTDQWQVSTDGKALEWIAQPGCRIYAPDSIYSAAELPPDLPDGFVTLGYTPFHIYPYLHGSTSGLMYRAPDGINKDVSGNMPVVLFVEWQSPDDPGGDCRLRAQAVMEGIRSQP